MPKVALETVGCRLNQYETDRIAAEFASRGFIRVSYREKADVYVLNTCTVTSKADADSRKLINRALRLNPDAVMAVTGCYVVSGSEAIAAIEGVDLMIDNREKMRLPEIVIDKYPSLAVAAAPESRQVCFNEDEMQHLSSLDRNRPMVKIGDGCNQKCSYCIVPRVRGSIVSYPADQILEEINRLAEAGYREVVLTAVHIGKYRAEGITLGDLLQQILECTPIGRVRLSSLEPNELDDQLLNLVAGHDRVCRHLHLPLQSGSDKILALMKRPYRRQDFLEVAAKVKKANTSISLGSDVIVGFPGETEDDFRALMEIAESGCLDYGHVFSYSDRPGTPASEMSEKIDVHTVRDRSRRLREVFEYQQKRHACEQIGSVLGAVPSPSPKDPVGAWGITDNYFRVRIENGYVAGREILPVRIDACDGVHLVGSVVT